MSNDKALPIQICNKHMFLILFTKLSTYTTFNITFFPFGNWNWRVGFNLFFRETVKKTLWTNSCIVLQAIIQLLFAFVNGYSVLLRRFCFKPCVLLQLNRTLILSLKPDLNNKIVCPFLGQRLFQSENKNKFSQKWPNDHFRIATTCL